MGRRATPLSCEAEVRSELERVSRSRTEPRQRVDRARIILACLSGEPQTQIAKRLNTRPNTVSKWRLRFAQQGLKGLADAPRSGKPPIYGPALRTKLLATLETPPPKGQARWDGSALAKALGAKKSIVYTLLAKDGIHLQRRRTWCVSTDPQFAAKAADIVGLYLAPPQKALVLSVDEKPSIQALSRATGYVRTSSGKIARGLKSTYRRNGTLNLFAALNVATGKVRNKTTATKTRADFQAFMDEVVADVPADQQIHVILDIIIIAPTRKTKPGSRRIPTSRSTLPRPPPRGSIRSRSGSAS